MAISLVPETLSIFNEYDRQGLLLGLNRLKDEKNVSYKQRLLDVFVNRADSTYRGLINGITRELGLQIENTLKIVADSSLTNPAIRFKDTKCYIYSDIATNTLVTTLDRWSQDGGNYLISDLINSINDTGYFIATLLDDSFATKRSMTIFNQSSAILVDAEDIDTSHSRIKLKFSNLIPTTVSVQSDNLVQRVATLNALRDRGQYYIDYVNGILYTRDAPSVGSKIRYEAINYSFIFQSSPVIINNLQSADFKTKMFEQVAADFIEQVNGLPTDEGALIINELLSVFGTSFSR